MLYLYDQAICEDLRRSFNDVNMGSTTVKVVDPDLAIDAVSQIQNDEFEFPAVVVTRGESYSVDTQRFNFTRLHRGVSVVIDKETNTLYDEKALPVTLSYNITVLCTNTQDMDELTRELIFKYMEQYFLSIQLPYESNRKIRFGLTVDPDQPIETTSRALQYLTTGKAYQTIIHLKAEGCVLLTYTPRALPRYEQQVDVDVSSRHYSEV